MIRRSLGVLALKVLGAGLTLAWNVLLARELGPGGFGTFALAFACVTLLGTLARMGLDLVVLGDVALSLRRGDRQALWAVVASAAAVAILVGGFLALALVLCRGPIATVFGVPQLAELLLVVAPAVPLVALNWLAGEALKGFSRPGLGVATHWVFPLGVFTLSLVLAGQIDLRTAGTRFVLAYGISVVAASVAVVRLSAPAAGSLRMWSGRTLRGMLSRGRPLLLLAGVNMLLMWTDVFMLGVFEDSATVGVYTAALRLSALVSFSLVAVSSVVTPEFAAASDPSLTITPIGKLARRAAGLSAAVAGVLALGCAFLARDLLGLFGGGFGVAIVPLGILLLSQFLHSVLGIGGYALVMAGGEREMGSAVAVAGAANVALNATLIPVLGMTGAALSTGLATLLMDARAVQALLRRVSRR